MKPWYSRLGPLSWYRNPAGGLEWVCLDLFWGEWLLLHLLAFSPSEWVVDLLGRVDRVSRYGNPVELSPRFFYTSRKLRQYLGGAHWGKFY